MSNFYQSTEQLRFLSDATKYVMNTEVLTYLYKIAETDDKTRLRIVKYILTGEDENILKYCYISHIQTEVDACSSVYEIIFESMNAEQIIRFSKILTKLRRTEKNIQFLNTQAPYYMACLIAHALFTTTTYPRAKTNRDNWTYAKMLEVFGTVEETPEIYLVDMLLKGNINTTPIDSHDFIFDNAHEVENILPTLTIGLQEKFFKFFLPQYSGFVETHPKSIALLCVSDSKEIRGLAVAKLADIAPQCVQPYLQDILKTGKAKEKSWAVDALITIGEGCLPILEQALTTEKTKSVQKKLQQAIQRLTMLQASTQDAYEIPKFQPLEITQIPDSFIEVMKQNADEIYEERKKEYERLVAEDGDSYYIKRAKEKLTDTETMLQNIDSACESVLKTLNGESINLAYSTIATHKNSVQKIPEYGLLQAMVLSGLRYSYRWRSLEPFVTTAMLENLELRHFQQVLETTEDLKICEKREKDYKRDIASTYLSRYADNYPLFTTKQVVPFFMTYPELIAEALGLVPQNDRYDFKFENALKVLTLFPQIPDQYIPKLLEVALGTQKSLRFECQELLVKVPNIHLQAIEALADSKAEIRVTAVEWLGRLGDLEESSHQSNIRLDIIQALHDLMKKEKKEAVTTAILSALEHNDDDISVFLTPEILLKEAQKGLKGKVSKTFTWFDVTLLPTVNWQDGTPVDSEIIQWWAILAEKLKQPSPNELFQRYVSLLNDSSQKILSLFMLQSFINQDLDLYSLTESEKIADTLVPELWGEISHYGCLFPNGYGIKDTWSKQYPDMPLVSEELMRPYVLAQLQKTAKGSAIKSKGLLALAHKATGSTVLELLNNYIKNYHRRTSQIGVLIDAFAVSDEPLIIQWILSISRRYRTKSIQEKAIDSINETAKRNHWTQHQLADRTIPMAGVDDEGILTLEYDSRNLTAYIDEKYTFVLQNETGKVIKSLPAPRKEDDTKIIKEAKSIFSASKKELKQMTELQTARLYEAMCSERLWDVAEWLEYLFAHPIMKRLVARLIWLEVDNEGSVVQAFRPSDDGKLLNLDDDEITLATNNQIKLAHKVLLSSEECKAWKQHIKDYEIKPLFSQLDNIPPKYDDEAVEFDDFRGYLTTAYKLRSAVTKLGYQRGVIGDGGGFKDYVKTYDIGGTDSLGKSQGLVVTMNFGGGDMSEEDIDTVLLTLTFTRKGDSSWQPKLIPLAEIPPILLAESYAEYAKLAKGTDGFDVDWESKSDYC